MAVKGYQFTAFFKVSSPAINRNPGANERVNDDKIFKYNLLYLFLYYFLTNNAPKQSYISPPKSTQRCILGLVMIEKMAVFPWVAQGTDPAYIHTIHFSITHRNSFTGLRSCSFQAILRFPLSLLLLSGPMGICLCIGLKSKMEDLFQHYTVQVRIIKSTYHNNLICSPNIWFFINFYHYITKKLTKLSFSVTKLHIK